MQTTGNLGLKKPEGTDIVDIADLNGNMDILDNAVTSKVDKVTGKQLSTNDYTAAEKTKLAGIATGANNYTHPNHTGDVTSNGDGVTAIAAGVIVNADVNAAAGIDASKIGTGVVSNAEFGYLDGVTSGIQGQLNGKAPLVTTPQQTTADITYYVRTDGNDNNTGLVNASGGAFRTIQRAVSMIPKIVNHTVIVNIGAGTYAGDIVVSGFVGEGAIQITGDSVLSATRNLQSVSVVNCGCHIEVIGINASRTVHAGFYIKSCAEILLYRCSCVTASPSFGYFVESSKVYINECQASNRYAGVYTHVNGDILVQYMTGSGNVIGYQSMYNGKTSVSLSTLSATTMYSTNFGGNISDNIGVLNPWGDNTLTSHSATRVSMGGNANFAANTFTKAAFSTIHQDYSNEFNTTLNRFTAKKTGWYLVSGGITAIQPPVGTAVSLILCVNGSRETILGSFTTSGGAQGTNLAVQGASCLYIPAGAYVELYLYPNYAITTLSGSIDSHFTITQVA